MLALARLYLTVDDLDSCQQQCVQLLKMDSENDAATVVSTFSYASTIQVQFLAHGNQINTGTTLRQETAITEYIFGHTKQKLYITSGRVKYSPFLLIFARSFTFTFSFTVVQRYCCKIFIPTRGFLVCMGGISRPNESDMPLNGVPYMVRLDIYCTQIGPSEHDIIAISGQ